MLLNRNAIRIRVLLARVGEVTSQVGTANPRVGEPTKGLFTRETEARATTVTQKGKGRTIIEISPGGQLLVIYAKGHIR